MKKTITFLLLSFAVFFASAFEFPFGGNNQTKAVTTVKITPTLGLGMSQEYIVPAGQNELVVNLNNCPSGLYLVSLIINNEVKNTLQISK